MCKGKHTRARHMKHIHLKSVLAVLSVVLVFCCVIGGTVAWLVDSTDTVTNTFTYGDINIDLDETDSNDGDGDENTNKYPMIPGHTITKDPIITVYEGSEASWLFVKLEKKGANVTVGETTYTFDDYLTYEPADGWTALEGVDGVYYRAVAKTTADTALAVLKNNEVKVKTTVTKEMLNALDFNEDGTAKDPAAYPVLEVTAYAVQNDRYIDTVEKAWDAVQNPTGVTTTAA